VRPRRAAAWLAGVWAGVVAGLGFVAAPVVFATLPRTDAGRAAGRLFAVDATLGVCIAAVLLVLTLQLARQDPDERGASRFSVETMCVLGALFCIVAGHYALVPMMEAAARGEPAPPFAALHGVASAFFVAKFACIAALAWRLVGAPHDDAAPATAAAPTS
jgi:uncharacterized protein DUF4149